MHENISINPGQNLGQRVGGDTRSGHLLIWDCWKPNLFLDNDILTLRNLPMRYPLNRKHCSNGCYGLFFDCDLLSRHRVHHYLQRY